MLTWVATSAARPSAASETVAIKARCNSTSSTAAPSAIAIATTTTAAAVDRLRTLARRNLELALPIAAKWSTP
ncbi:hypothetical protein GCM10009804_64430 [Kribbella hippodromi]|uniref:Secreted protein n=1 Tax=Kribbella hippodromi TaxID=434347 RepID=A0ABP4Q309_9ACTN